MKFSKMCDYKGVAHFIVKTGRKNIRILLPGQPYEKSFVVPLKKVSNRRPAEYEPEDDLDEVEVGLGDELVEAPEIEEESEQLTDEYQPQ
jgi:ribosomal protein S8